MGWGGDGQSTQAFIFKHHQDCHDVCVLVILLIITLTKVCVQELCSKVPQTEINVPFDENQASPSFSPGAGWNIVFHALPTARNTA